MDKTSKPVIQVWDLLVRLGHWTLVAGVAAAWFSHGKWHEWLGYAVLGVVALRIVWGLTGPRYARFSQFVRCPSETLRYARQVRAREEPRYLGHNPLGGWMIIALLTTLVGVCTSGWLYTTDAYWGEKWVEEVHEALTHVLLVLVALHVGGVIFSSLRHGENLVLAMIHGRKQAPRGNDIT